MSFGNLNSFNVLGITLCNFSHSLMETLNIFFYLLVYGLSVKHKNSLGNIVKICSMIVGVQLTDLRKQMVQKVKGTIISHY